MALAFPEGECFFRRDGLVSPRAGGYDARNERQFYSTMLVEFLWNVPSHSENAGVNYPNGHFHPRTGYTITRRDSRIRQGNFNNLPFSYGPSEWQIRRRVQHELCLDPLTLQDYYFGNSVAHVRHSLQSELIRVLTVLSGVLYGDPTCHGGGALGLDRRTYFFVLFRSFCSEQR